jgi:hypothetical protein
MNMLLRDMTKARNIVPVGTQNQRLSRTTQRNHMTLAIVSALRDMLRNEFGLADNRDMAVAQAVQAWYFKQFPHLGVLIDQPDLAAIIAKVRTPGPKRTMEAEADLVFTDLLAHGISMIRIAPADFLANGSQEELNAARYLALRNLPDELLGATGVPGIAVPEGPDHGNFVSAEDADRIIDAYIARTKS